MFSFPHCPYRRRLPPFSRDGIILFYDSLPDMYEYMHRTMCVVCMFSQNSTTRELYMRMSHVGFATQSHHIQIMVILLSHGLGYASSSFRIKSPHDFYAHSTISKGSIVRNCPVAVAHKRLSSHRHRPTAIHRRLCKRMTGIAFLWQNVLLLGWIQLKS